MYFTSANNVYLLNAFHLSGESEPVTEDETEPMGIETDVSSSLKHLPSAQVPQGKQLLYQICVI